MDTYRAGIDRKSEFLCGQHILSLEIDADDRRLAVYHRFIWNADRQFREPNGRMGKIRPETSCRFICKQVDAGTRALDQAETNRKLAVARTEVTLEATEQDTRRLEAAMRAVAQSGI